MKLLMLRAEITNSNEKYMCHSSIKEEDDWYVLLINQLLLDGYVDEAEVWFYGKKRKPTTYSSGLKLKYNNLEGNFKPDVVFARGGFPKYVKPLKLMKEQYNSTIVYYGAGARYLPEDGIDYDHILVDSQLRKNIVKTHFPNSKVHLFRKGCAEHLFQYKDTKKIYDVGNVTSIPVNKGQDTIGSSLQGTGLKFINIGQFTSDTVKKYRQWGIDAFFTGRLPRKSVAQFIRQCKFLFVGDHWRAGLPRVIPEAMSCGTFVIMLDDIPVSKEYKSSLCMVETRRNLLKQVLNNSKFWNYNSKSIHKYYQEHFSLKKCAESFANQILGG